MRKRAGGLVKPLFRPLRASASLREIRLFLLLGAFVASGLGQVPARDDFIRTDPAKVVLPEACGECHRSTLALWKTTPHATVYDELHRKESALEIAKAMGFFLVKRESLCLKCHYTPVVRRETLRAAAGVSCESCHGAALDWINVHSSYGVPESDFQKARLLETPQHRSERRANSQAAGMLRPSNLYAVASNCFQCHTVPHEKLVNLGRHSTGSAGFELLAWSQGDIRHNFLDSFLTGDGTVNAQRPPHRRRMLYLMGRALDLEYSLRGLAAATENGRYYKAMRRRYRNALSEMKEIAARTALPEVGEMLSALRGRAVNFGNQEELLRRAEAVSRAAQQLSSSHDGTLLASLDPLIAGEGSLDLPADEGAPDDGANTTPKTTLPLADEGSAAVPTPSPDSTEEVLIDKPTPGTPATGSERATTPGRRPRTVSEVGRILTRPPWRTLPQHRSIGPSVCSGCHDHSDQDEWWLDDPHYLSADPLLDEELKALQIARFYGLKSRQMKRGDQICMQCHASIISGRENREVTSGVGCERCHGPGEDFKEPHQKSRDQALQLGMADLKDLSRRAAGCAGCHYINEPRLISAGHPTGRDFDLGERNAKIRHWEHALADPAKLRAAYRNVIARRGAIPTVRVLDLDVPLADNAGGGSRRPASAGRVSQPVGSGASGAAARQPRTPLSQAAAFAGQPQSSPTGRAAAPGSAAQPSAGQPRQALPEAELSVEETLLLIKQRLERLYQEMKRR
ncbi:MAG: multiheme c-type cytochrome [Acidobacteriota bacterium]